MRKLPFIATTLLCSSLALAQEDDYSDNSYDSEVATEASAEEAPAEEAVAEEEPAPAVEEAAAEEAPAEEPAAEEPAVEEVPSDVALAPEVEAPKKEMASTAPAAVPAAVLDAPKTLGAEKQLETIENNLDNLAENMESTLMGKDDAPLAVSGFMAFRLKNFHYPDAPALLAADQARTSVDAVFKANIVAMPNSYMTLWTNITMPFDLSGLFTNKLGSQPTGVKTYNEHALYDHSTDYYSTTIDEEMNFGVDIRAGVFGAYVTAGGVIWANSSPLTMWERETNPRFAWQYELFEDEKTVSTYYKEKVFKPVKEGGRAFWTNRSFGGVFASIYQLPWDLTAQAMVSQPADADIGTRDGLRMYGGQPGELEMSGDYDFRGSIYHGRLAKNKIADNLTVGVNYMGVIFDNALVYEPEFFSSYNKYSVDPTISNNHVASIDFKGNITPKLYLMTDVAVSMTQDQEYYKAEGAANTSKYEKNSYETSMSTPAVGVYVKAQSKYLEGWPMTLEAIFLQKDFYSPYSMSNPSRFVNWRKDEFALNSGSMRYTPNMAGLNLKVEPEFTRGHLDLQYGLHRQVEEGMDVINFNYRLNGRNLWESTNSWTKHKPLFWADSGNAGSRANGYVERAGVQAPGTGLKLNRQQGGLRGGTWEMWETFAAYENAQQIADSTVPTHAKWSTYLSVAGGYDIGHWFGTDRNIVMSGYAAISGVSTTIAPIAYSEAQSDMLMWSFYGQFEPAIAITPSFHLVGVLGLETFRSEYGYVNTNLDNQIAKPNSDKATHYGVVSTGYYEKAPINIVETAIGLGFDWDFADRAGLHFRYKWATHSDEVLSANDWTGHYITAETKVWF
ncbi:hypothetical protein [Fibrobacter sp. UWEL]|uniref:hypothetical protein n=1 Tax=Fibrobacter sp. UWEL TaxID=1896209 RepID=UPI00091BDA5B|nr:hypothetical protein [Fibrobacter sp. UWEL]SHK76883.1 hypothetical protein SAMN05720468_106131 [Fibrobacter sp. UWEL]